MINPSNILTVLTYDGSTYVNRTQEASDIHGDDFTFDLSSTKFIYVGYTKPISSIYWYLIDGKNNVSTQTKVEYYNGTAWTQVSIVDQTVAFNRNGMMNWQAPTDPSTVVVNSIEKYWLRFSTQDATTPNLKFQYIGLTLSDDNDIKSEFPSLLQSAYYPTGQNDFMSYHLSSKEYIMAELLRRGYTKTVGTDVEPINQWDILDVYELRQASLYYTMSQIFFTLSDNSSDNFWQKYLDYKNKFEIALNVGMLRIDQDNDGQTDTSEKLPITSYRWVR